MRAIWLGLALGAATVAGPAAAEDPVIEVRGDAARAEIQRILDADNLDTELLGSRGVAETLAAIERGRAPDDFWTAYQTHVRAWQAFAAAEEEARRAAEQPDALAAILPRLVEAEAQIETTFDEVERIARGYGARMPVPVAELRQIT